MLLFVFKYETVNDDFNGFRAAFNQNKSGNCCPFM